MYKSFYEVLKFSNYKVLKCYKLIFKSDSITKNIGRIIVIIFACIYLIFIILYFIKGNYEIAKSFNLIKNNINNDKKKEIKSHIIAEDKNNIFKKSPLKTKTKRIKKKRKSRKSKKSIASRKENFPPKKLKFKLDNDTKISLQNKNDIKIITDKDLKSKNKIINRESQLKKLTLVNISSKIEKNCNDIVEEKLDDYELNNLEYDEAIKLDKRKFIKIYWSLLKREHLILFTFFNRNDYNIIYIKLAGFIFFNLFRYGFKCFFLR